MVRSLHFYCTVLLVSDVWHSDSGLYINIKVFRFFSLISYYKILSIIPCAIQKVAFTSFCNGPSILSLERYKITPPQTLELSVYWVPELKILSTFSLCDSF